jgi:hypothetical protein
MTTTTKSLEQKIEIAVEQLVREHLAACEAAAAAAMRRIPAGIELVIEVFAEQVGAIPFAVAPAFAVPPPAAISPPLTR